MNHIWFHIALGYKAVVGFFPKRAYTLPLATALGRMRPRPQYELEKIFCQTRHQMKTLGMIEELRRMNYIITLSQAQLAM